MEEDKKLYKKFLDGDKKAFESIGSWNGSRFFGYLYESVFI